MPHNACTTQNSKTQKRMLIDSEFITNVNNILCDDNNHNSNNNTTIIIITGKLGSFSATMGER